MIRFDKGALEIKGTNIEVLTDFNFIVNELLDSHPEIVLATFFERNEELIKCLSRCNKDYLNCTSIILKNVMKLTREDK